ncbi:hypothetical protein [Cellvibrio sp.]
MIIVDEKLMEQWTKQKYDYYVSARTLWENNQMQMAALMYAYAIEAQIKSAFSLFPNTCSRKDLERHNISKLFAQAKNDGIFNDVSASDDFLDFVMDNFHRRYPRQTNEQLINARQGGRGFALISNLNHYYDQFIIDLDNSIYRKSKDCRSSMFFLAKRDLESVCGKYFFILNPAALSRLDDAILWLAEEVDDYQNDNFEHNNLVHIAGRKRELAMLINMRAEWLNRDKEEVSSLNIKVDTSAFVHPGKFANHP